jgi:two-component system CheB/CheR fusion protein
LANKLIDYARFPDQSANGKALGSEKKVAGMMQKIYMLLRTRTGHDFSLYKKNTLFRRIERRMTLHHIHDMEEYVRLLQDSTKELESLFKELLIGVTKFFRDKQAFEILEEKLLPDIIKAKGGMIPCGYG